MENASKALIIAGSILLSILIIALGMYIFSTSSSTSDVSVLSETEVQTFNAKFEKYNKEQIGSNVDALIKAVRSNATANKGSAEKVPTVNFTSSGKSSPDIIATGNKDITNEITNYNGKLTEMTNAIEKSHRYTVDMVYDDGGLITTINIKY